MAQLEFWPPGLAAWTLEHAQPGCMPAQLHGGRYKAVFRSRIEELGPIQQMGIEVAPFEIQRFGIRFGLIPEPPEEEDDDWAVIAEPGNYMAFYPPWDGDYDT